MTNAETIIDMQHVKANFAGTWVHKDINLSIRRGEIIGIVGGSGSGKTTLMREILMLRPPDGGTIKVFGCDVTKASTEKFLQIQKRWGVLFQQNALFSSLTVLENTTFPLKEHTQLDAKTMQELALLKIILAGLPVSSAIKYPSELSGGMQKRAGLARAIVLDPEIIFLDEPTAGLDPNNVRAFDDLILHLQETMGLTIIVISHDIESLKRVTNRVAFLGEGKVLSVEPLTELMRNPNPMIRDFFKIYTG